MKDRRCRLEFERKMLRSKTIKIVESFEDNLEDLRVERNTVLSDLKLSELKLIAMSQEYSLLMTYEVKDIYLQLRQKKCRGEKNEISNSMIEFQSKINVKANDLHLWNETLASVSMELKSVIPER